VHCSTFPESVKVASAVCLRKLIKGHAKSGVSGKNKAEKNNKKTFSFALSWDNPIVRFGEGAREVDRSNTTGSEAASASIGFEAPRYYTRFFGDSGNSSSAIAVYGLVYAREWERRIVKWQEKVLLGCDAAMTSRDSTSDLTDRESSSISSSGKTDSVAAAYSSDADADADTESQAEDDYRRAREKLKEKQKQRQSTSESYRHQLFNELYFLVDGGTVWTDTRHGISNLYAPFSVQDNGADRRGSLGGVSLTDSGGNGGNRVSQVDEVAGEASKERDMKRRSGMLCDVLSSIVSVPIRDFSIESFLKDKQDFSELSGKMTPESMDRCHIADTVGKNSRKMKAKNSNLPLESLREPLLRRLTGLLSWSRQGGAEASESEESRATGVAERGASQCGDGDCDTDREGDVRVAEHRRKSRKIMKAISVLHQQMLDHDRKVANSKIAGDQVLIFTRSSRAAAVLARSMC
jgi:beta-glucosidase 2, glycosyl-hydrolase family 116 N-term